MIRPGGSIRWAISRADFEMIPLGMNAGGAGPLRCDVSAADAIADSRRRPPEDWKFSRIQDSHSCIVMRVAHESCPGGVNISDGPGSSPKLKYAPFPRIGID